jgi:UDP:flavonoid glycosyltransferase YjiC (YdhE family)
MRVLVSVSGWPAHYFPMVPLGWALRAAGHEVQVACPASQAAAVQGAGLSPVPILGDLDMAYLLRFSNLWAASEGNWPYSWAPIHPETGEAVDLASFDMDAFIQKAKRHIALQSKAGFEAALEFAAAFRPDLVLHDRMSAEGLLAAKVQGVPAVAHLWGPVGTAETDPELYPLPVDYTRAFPRHDAGTLDADAISHVIDPSPAQIAPPVRGQRLGIRYVPYNGPGAAPATLPPAGDRPRVCVVWSNSMSAMYGAGAYLVPTIIEALAGLDAEVILPVHADDAGALGDLPPNVTVLGQTPLHLLLPGCTAVVHHGGAGCAMTALDAGLPQLALTFGAEQDAIGRRIAATGAGRHFPGHRATASQIQAAVQDLIATPEPAAVAARLAGENQARPTPAQVTAELEELALAS